MNDPGNRFADFTSKNGRRPHVKGLRERLHQVIDAPAISAAEFERVEHDELRDQRVGHCFPHLESVQLVISKMVVKSSLGLADDGIIRALALHVRDTFGESPSVPGKEG